MMITDGLDMFRQKYLSHMVNKFYILLIAFCCLFISACSDDKNSKIHDLNDKINDEQIGEALHQHDGNNNRYLFGFDLRSSPQEDARQYLPFLKYLEKATGYQFHLQFTPKNSRIIDELGENKVQFAALGATSFIEAQMRYGVKPLVRGINHQGKAEYQSMFVVRPKSNIKTLSELKGKRFAFGSQTSTQGHLIPRIILEENNISLEKLMSYTYTGSHQNCANSVISNKADICGMQDTMAKNMANQGLVKILHTSNYYPSSGIAYNPDISNEVVEKMKQALMAFDPKGKHKHNLYNWDKTEMPGGFTAAKSSDYDELLNWSVKLGFLQSVNN